MKQTGFNSFRTSIQWSRLIDDFETGTPNAEAVRFYNNYFDEMIASGIEPMINLYHFDMPEILQKQYGGFESPHVTDLFARFARTAFELFGHKVKYWITFNEPIVPVEGGYLYDFHYPCKKMASWRRRLHLTLCWRMQKRCTCTGNLSYRAK